LACPLGCSARNPALLYKDWKGLVIPFTLRLDQPVLKFSCLAETCIFIDYGYKPHPLRRGIEGDQHSDKICNASCKLLAGQISMPLIVPLGALAFGTMALVKPCFTASRILS